MICAACRDEIDRAERCPSCGEPARLEGDYVLTESVGQGGMGRTYRAERASDGEVVAVKELPVSQLDDVKAMELFEREASVLRQLDHRGVPHYYDHFSAGEGRSLAMYLVQEFIDGETLEEATQEWRPGEEEVVDLMVDVLEIFDYLHDLDPPVVHRDVKPSNLMRRAGSGDVVLIDFGSVRAALEPDAQGGSTVAGTFGYMAPEQFMGRASPASDVYSLGATAVALLSRKAPRQLMNHERELEWRCVVDVDPSLAAVLDEMLASDPANRPGDASELASRLRQVQRGEAPVRDVSASAAVSTAPSPPFDPGPAPRSIPDDFSEEFAPSVRVKFTLGGIFSAIGVVFAVLLIAFVVSGGRAEAAFGIGLFGLLFGGVGAVVLVPGIRRWRMLREVFRTGERTRGEIVRTRLANYSVNGQKPLRLFYEFEIGGRRYEGWRDSYDHRGLQVDDPVDVELLYDPEDPSRNLLLV